MSGPHSERISSRPTDRVQHLPPRFLELDQRVRAIEGPGSDSEPIYVGPFRIIRRLGAGGFGIVFLGLDLKLDRLVAVKLCPVSTPEASARLAVEASMLAMFNHPNIVRVYEVGVHGGDVFYAMEYIEGGDGGAYIKRWCEWESVVSVYVKAAAGLAAAHEKDVVHGDFKPENVLLGDDGRVCVADFGLARLIDQQPEEADERVSHRIGTLPYMAPELLNGEPASPATDQWALCVSLWETLYFERPFAGRTVAALLESIEAGLPRPLGMIPWSVQAVLRRGLSIDPADRYPDMRALIEALQLTLGPVAANGATPPKRRNVFAYALCVAGGVVLGAYGWAHRPQAIDPAPERESTEPEPAPDLSAFPCVLDGRVPGGLDQKLVAVCRRIRGNQIDDAHDLWKQERDRRLVEIDQLAGTDDANRDRLRADLTADSDIVTRTFKEQAALLETSDPELAARAVIRARYWAAWAEESAREWSAQP